MPDVAHHCVGVVAIGRNEGDRLLRCLNSLTRLNLPVVYVDSNSTDGSVDAARAAGASVVELDVTIPFTAARARNAGLQTLRTSYPETALVQFVDGDCEVVASWIPAAARFLAAHPDIAAVCGRRRERFVGASVYNGLCDVEWNTSVGEAEACGGDAMFRMPAIVAAGGFDPAMIAGEEPELCSRLRAAGWRIFRLDEEMTVHDAAMLRFGQWWRRAVRSGFGYAQAWAATRRRHAPLYGRELTRISGWAVALPIASLTGAMLVHPALLALAPAALSMQIARMAARDGPGRLFAWQRATLLSLGRFAELQGVLRFAWRSVAGRTGGTIVYK